MSTLEVVLNMLGEAMATAISQTEEPVTFEENKAVAKRGGGVAATARQEGEKETGQPIITSKKAIDFSKLINDICSDEEE